MAEYLDEGLEGSRESRPETCGLECRDVTLEPHRIEYRQPALNGERPDGQQALRDGGTRPGTLDSRRSS